MDQLCGNVMDLTAACTAPFVTSGHCNNLFPSVRLPLSYLQPIPGIQTTPLMFVLLEIIIRHPSTWACVVHGHSEQAEEGLERDTSSSRSGSNTGGVDSNSSSSSRGRSNSSSGGGGNNSSCCDGGAGSSRGGNNSSCCDGGAGSSRGGNSSSSRGSACGGESSSSSGGGGADSSSGGNGSGNSSSSGASSSGCISCGKGKSSSCGQGRNGNTTSSSRSENISNSSSGYKSSRDSVVDLDASERGCNDSNLALTRASTGSLLAPLHLLVLLTHPSRCSPAVHASSMAAALPLLGALVSSAKAVRLSGVMFLQPPARVEPFYLLLLLSRHAFQLLEGKLNDLQGSTCKQQHTSGEREASGANLEEMHHDGQLQQGPQQQVCWQQDANSEICRAFLRSGLQLSGIATTAILSFAGMAGTLSLECIRNQQLADALVAAAPPSFQHPLKHMLQQARWSARGEAVGQQEEGASTAAAGAAAPRRTGTGAAKGGGGQGLTVAAGEAGRTAAERGGGAKSRVGGEAVLESTAKPAATLAAAPAAAMAGPSAEVAAAADLLKASAASQLYSGLQGLCKRPGGLVALIDAECIARNKLEPEVEPEIEWLYSVQHGIFWQQVVADTEEGIEPPGRLLGCLFQSAASFHDVFKLVPDQLLFAGDAASGKLLQMVRAAPSAAHLSLDCIGGRDSTQGTYLAESAARYIHSFTTLLGKVSDLYHKASSVSFCCGNPGCLVMQGSSEVGLVTGGAAGRGGGGYCPGCKRMCYCSEACQRVCWEDHKGVCSRS